MQMELRALDPEVELRVSAVFRFSMGPLARPLAPAVPVSGPVVCEMAGLRQLTI
jgi:hypothetical protein